MVPAGPQGDFRPLNLKIIKINFGAAHGKRYTTSKFSVFVFSLILIMNLTKKPA